MKQKIIPAPLKSVSQEIELNQNAQLDQSSAQLTRLTEYLDYCRQQRKTATYLEVADAIGIQPPQRIHQLTQLLETLMESDHVHHQPLRAALVVSRNRAALPGEGFFIKAQALGLMDNLSAEEFHRQCLKQLFDGPASTATSAK